MTESDCMPRERRANAEDIRDIARCYHQLDTRVAVLETRMDAQDGRLGVIEHDLRETRVGVQRVLQTLEGHVEQENRDRVKLLVGIVTILVSVVGFGMSTAIRYWLG